MEIPRDMRRKRQRHFNESRRILSFSVIVAGVVVFICLCFVWPQSYSSLVFNSRLAYHLILDIEDYYTCDKDYMNFVIDEPDPTYSTFLFFLFNVSNAADVLQIGYKPQVAETGPYGFVKSTYKYDIIFPDQENSFNVSFKEYNVLKEVTNPLLCEEMYYKMDRSYLNPNGCPNHACRCQDFNSPITIVNPLFLKILWQETPHTMIAHYSVEAFIEIKQLFEGPFVEAVKAHLVTRSYFEVYNFRVQMQIGLLLSDAFNSLTKTYSVQQIATFDNTNMPSQCGLSKYGISFCPFFLTSTINNFKASDIADSDYPSLVPLLNRNNSDISFLNVDYGLSKFVGLCWLYKYVDFNDKYGYTIGTVSELTAVQTNLIKTYAVLSFGPNYSKNQLLGTSRIVQGICKFLSSNWILPYSSSSVSSLLQTLAKNEFIYSHNPVSCTPLSTFCVWQIGYMSKYRGFNHSISKTMVDSFIDISTQVSTNPNSFYKDVNGPPAYNSYLYCNNVYNKTLEKDITCYNYQYTFNDGKYSRPAGFWAIDTSRSTFNLSDTIRLFKKESTSVKNKYFDFACGIANLKFDVFRNATDYHDIYIISYLNKYTEDSFNHTFERGKWEDIGIAQWAGGFVTNALELVRTTNQLVYDGMWRFGKRSFYDNFIEFSSWCVKQGFPNAYIYSIDDARLLLSVLASKDPNGLKLRTHISYRGTTFIGDGINYVNSMGDVGDVGFTLEANYGNFSCAGDNNAACNILNMQLSSSASNCQLIENLYLTCYNQYNFNNDKWINLANCYNFQTSISSPTQGIQCDLKSVYGNLHPYIKKRGNVVYGMMFTYVKQLQLLDGLWCTDGAKCDYKLGGMFATTTVRKLLFDGFTDPSILKFLNLKHEANGINFQCATTPYDYCGNQRYQCDSNGLILQLPNNHTKHLLYGLTSHDEFFAPYFEIASDGEMLWSYSMNQSVANYAATVKKSQDVVKVSNPIWVAYPAWNTLDRDFNKFIQCQKRLYSGVPNLFTSCVETMYTGRDNVNNSLSLVEYHGNSSIYFFGSSFNVNGSSEEKGQLPMYLWSGFKSYPYLFKGLSAGPDYYTTNIVNLFNKHHALNLKLSQNTLLYVSDREIPFSLPLPSDPVAAAKSATTRGQQSLQLTVPSGTFSRRFAETTETWDKFRNLGNPLDSNGMPYRIPAGMASLQLYSDFTLFIETPHSYGNTLWGGDEHNLVLGIQPYDYSQRTFIDYEPITGKILRSATRQQINIRVEANPLFPIAFQSQSRCSVPTKIFQGGSGYGCFTYIPLLWFEDARIINQDTFESLYVHFYQRPTRANSLITLGLIIGAILLFLGIIIAISEAYFKQRFKKRIYVD